MYVVLISGIPIRIIPTFDSALSFVLWLSVKTLCVLLSRSHILIYTVAYVFIYHVFSMRRSALLTSRRGGKKGRLFSDVWRFVDGHSVTSASLFSVCVCV